MAPFPSFTKTWHASTYPAISPTRPSLSLAGKTVVITGGGAGIGFAITKSVAQAGATNIAILGRRKEVLDKAVAAIHDLVGSATNVLSISADVAKKEEVNAAFDAISAKFGGKSLDILISNAGSYSGVRPLGTETIEEWQTNVNVNMFGVYNAAIAFVAKAAPDATIINVSSAVAHFTFPGFSSYAATKLAGSTIVKYVQGENPGMHVVDVHPGQVRETDMAAKLEGVAHIDDAELPGDFVVWLASSEAKFLKGKFVWCNWDVDDLKAAAKEIEASTVLTVGGLDGFADFKY